MVERENLKLFYAHCRTEQISNMKNMLTLLAASVPTVEEGKYKCGMKKGKEEPSWGKIQSTKVNSRFLESV